MQCKQFAMPMEESLWLMAIKEQTPIKLFWEYLSIMKGNDKG